MSRFTDEISEMGTLFETKLTVTSVAGYNDRARRAHGTTIHVHVAEKGETTAENKLLRYHRHVPTYRKLVKMATAGAPRDRRGRPLPNHPNIAKLSASAAHHVASWVRHPPKSCLIPHTSPAVYRGVLPSLLARCSFEKASCVRSRLRLTGALVCAFSIVRRNTRS